jgi:hypothetical protein
MSTILGQVSREAQQAVDWLGTFLVLGVSLMILLGLNLGGVINS